MCCRDGKKRVNTQLRKTVHSHQKPSRKVEGCCISRMYDTEFHDGHVEVKCISAHTSHELGTTELPYLPLPKGTKEEIAIKLTMGISEKIMDGNGKI